MITSRTDFSPRRECERCARPERACVCACVTAITPKVEVLILQHPLEVSHPKGTARLLHLCLTGSRLLVGESFDPEFLQEVLHSPLNPHSGGEIKAQPVLLYPGPSDSPPAHWNEKSATTRLRLVILDGTWRKSRKMLYANPLLQSLPRLSLTPSLDLPASGYAIRRAYRPEQLSTLEAAYHALIMLEKNEAKYQPLLHGFEQFIAIQQQWFKP